MTTTRSLTASRHHGVRAGAPRNGHAPLRGFTLIELMVTISIIAILMLLAMPSFGTASRSARERGVVARLIQDFTWARGAAGAATASALDSSLTAVAPQITLTLNADCTWSTLINGSANATHSMSSTQLALLAPGMTCSGTSPLLPATFAFTSQGFVSPTGTVTLSGATTTSAQLRVLYSGAIMRINGGQS